MTLFRPIFWVACSLAGGIILGHFFDSQIYSSLPIFLLSFFFISVSLALTKTKIIFWIFFSLGILFLGQSLHWQKINALDKNFPKGSLTLIGTIESFPIQLRSSSGAVRVRFSLRCAQLLQPSGKWIATNQKIMVSIPESAPFLRYGDQLLLKGEVLKTTSATNPGSFDPESYLEREGFSNRFFVKAGDDFMLMARGKGNSFIARVGRLKDFLIRMVETHIPSPEGGVVKAMLLGNREEISFEVRDYFSKSGTAHLLAISGLHVGLVASIFINFLQFLRFSRRLSYVSTIFLLMGYSVLTGAHASVLRATLMIILFLSGFIFKRESELVTSLSWAAILILVFEPLQLFDAGFQLSFLTVLCLGVLAPQWQTLEVGFLVALQKTGASISADKAKWIRLEKILFYFQNYLGVSLAAWIGILPLIAHYFFLFSPVTIFANIFVVPYLWVVIASGFAFLLLGSFSEFFQEALGSALWLFTKILIVICRWFSAIPWGHFRVPPPTVFDFLGFYALMLLWLFREKLGISKNKFLIILFIFLNLFVWKDFFHSPSKDLKITFLDVGHGDSALIEFPEKGKLLVDAGMGGDWDQGRMSVAPFLWTKGITRLDGILITHPHFDHYGGLKYLLNEFSVGTVFDNGDRSSALYEESFKGVKVDRRVLKEGDEIVSTKKVETVVLHPPKNLVSDSKLGPNNQSLIIQLRYRKFKILMSGDAESLALEEINRYGEKLESQLLKVPHHGGDGKIAEEEFLSYVKPQIAVISEAEKNRFNLPSKKTVELLHQLGIKIYQTGLTGAVEYITDGTTCSVKTMLKM